MMQRLTPQIRDKTIPVSFAQEYLLRTYRRENPGAAYNIRGAVRIASALDIGVVEKSVKELFHRHEILRTHFEMVGDEFIQVIDQQPHSDLVLVDLSAHPKDESTADAHRILAEIGQKPFDIWAGPLIRVGLCRLAVEDYFLIFVVHHLISDGWSLQNLVLEFDQLYCSFVQGLPSPLPPLSLQYADFAVWQRNRLQGNFLDQHIAYWMRQLKGAPLLELPTDRPRPSRRSYAGARRSVTLSPEMSAAVRELASRERVTPFIVFFATFATVLSEKSGQKDVVIGTPIGARVPGAEKLIGFLINTMPFRIDLSGDPCFRELLKRARDVTLEALAHHELPLVRLESELRRNGGGADRPPLFRVLFAMHNVLGERSSSSGLNMVAVHVDANTAKRDLTFFIYDWSDSIQGVLEYSTEIFEAATIESLLRQFDQLLEFAIKNPEVSMRKAS